MRILIELWELTFVLFPVILSGAIVWKPAQKISGWTFQVIASATIAFLSLGFLLMRLTTPCATTSLQCGEGLVPITRVGSPFGTCEVCAPSGAPDLITLLNSWAIPLQGASAALCVMGSLVTTLRFVFWARRLFASQPR